MMDRTKRVERARIMTCQYLASTGMPKELAAMVYHLILPAYDAAREALESEERDRTIGFTREDRPI